MYVLVSSKVKLETIQASHLSQCFKRVLNTVQGVRKQVLFLCVNHILQRALFYGHPAYIYDTF